jgi:hypothetical protein
VHASRTAEAMLNGVVGFGEIAGVMSSLKAAKDIAETMIGLRDAAAFQEKRIELRSRILDAQSGALAAQDERSSLVEKIRTLEAEIARLKAWDGEKEKYELQRVYPAAFAFVLKPNAGGAEPPHWLCAACHQKSQKSLLQVRILQGRDRFWACPSCKSEIKTGWQTAPEHPYIEAKPA